MAQNTTPKIATLGIADELRRMKIGDVDKFPMSQYRYNSVRACPSTSLAEEQCNGKNWKTRLDREERCVFVTRVS